MITLTAPSKDLLAFLAPLAINEYELHLLCDWGVCSHSVEGECSCSRMIRVTTALHHGNVQVAYILEPGTTHDEFWEVEAGHDPKSSMLVISDYAWRVALAQC